MRSLKDYLLNANYELDWLESPEGHSWGLWRATIDRMLEYFFPGNPSYLVADDNNVPEGFILYQNYPNPFNPSTTIKFSIPEISFVTLNVYDVLGNEIAILVNEEKPAGEYEVKFPTIEKKHASPLPSGIYFYLLKAGAYVETKKMLLLK